MNLICICIVCIGLTDETLEHLGKIGPKAQKTSRRDLSVVLSQVKTYLLKLLDFLY